MLSKGQAAWGVLDGHGERGNDPGRVVDYQGGHAWFYRLEYG